MKLSCWKCGHTAEDLPMPLGRREVCAACNADLHVCRQCQWYERSAPNGCREPVADPVSDKDRANFCGYFTLKSDAYASADTGEAAMARAKLASLFGEEPAGPDPAAGPNGQPDDEAARARRELESLFGLDKPKT